MAVVVSLCSIMDQISCILIEIAVSIILIRFNKVTKSSKHPRDTSQLTIWIPQKMKKKLRPQLNRLTQLLKRKKLT